MSRIFIVDFHVSMLVLLKAWLDLCLLRRAPQDLPASGFLLGLSVACYVLVSALVSLLGWGRVLAIPVALLDVGLLIVFVLILLYLQDKTARISQTLAALCGSGSLLGLLAVPLLLSAGIDGEVPVPLSLLMTALFFWNLVVVAHIMRHALSTSFAVGVAVSVLYALVSMQVVITVLPVSVSTG